MIMVVVIQDQAAVFQSVLHLWRSSPVSVCHMKRFPKSVLAHTMLQILQVNMSRKSRIMFLLIYWFIFLVWLTETWGSINVCHQGFMNLHKLITTPTISRASTECIQLQPELTATSFWILLLSHTSTLIIDFKSVAKCSFHLPVTVVVSIYKRTHD